MMSLLSSQLSLQNRSADKLRVDHLKDGLFDVFSGNTPATAFSSPENIRAEWERAMAEEALFARSCGRSIPNHWLERLKSLSPFGTEGGLPSLENMLEKRCACATFPLRTGKGGPQVGRIWVLLDIGKPGRAAKNPPGFSNNLTCLLVAPENMTGNSWHLAACLAARAIEAGTAETIQELATDWIITGSVKNDHIHPVILGNKLDLHTARQWLIPRENIKNLETEQQARLHIRSAPDLDTAWNIVTGSGSEKGESLPWPTQVDQLHILVGGNIKSGLASVLMSPLDAPVTIWHSKSASQSTMPARALGRLIKQIRPGQRVEDLHMLSSSDLLEAEKTLRRYFDKNPPAGKRVLFNVTSGNRLMSYAVQTLARLHPGIELIYRDVDASPVAPFVFTRLDYTRFPPTSGVYTWMPPAPCPLKFEFLFGREKYKDDTEQAIVQSVYRALKGV